MPAKATAKTKRAKNKIVKTTKRGVLKSVKKVRWTVIRRAKLAKKTIIKTRPKIQKTRRAKKRQTINREYLVVKTPVKVVKTIRPKDQRARAEIILNNSDFKFSNFFKHSLVKLTVLCLIVGLNWFGLTAVGRTLSAFNDTEESQGNIYAAGSLDFSLLSGSWNPEQKENALMPDDSVSKIISILNNGSLGFQYNASTTITGGDIDLCDALNLEARLEGAFVYDGLLKDFISSNYVFSSSTDDWAFETTLPFDAPEELQNKTCQFKFVFNGWQEDLSLGLGFYDVEEDINTLSSGTWIVLEQGTDNISPIADAYVNQEHADSNYDDEDYLDVRSKNDNKNKRAFIKFNFRFPAGTEIINSLMRLYLQDAPSNSRSYEAKMVENNWLENTIKWSNQPSASSTATDTIFSGTDNSRWLNWSVTGDVKNFVDGIYPNYGWRIGDTQENTGNNEGKFRSRDNSGDPEKRPILEITFKTPPATTTYPVINEVYYNVDGTKGNNTHNEWVEIYNPTASPIDISGWKICDTSCDIIPPSSPIPVKGFALIANSASTWTTYWVVPAGAVKIALGSEIGNGLNNDGDRVYLKDASDTTIDKMSYGNDVSVFVLPDSGEGKSLARIVKGYDNDLATDWIINATPNPGTNPSGDDGIEIIRFTDEGIEVASSAEGLPALTETANDLVAPVESLPEIAPAPEETSVLPTELLTDTSGTPASTLNDAFLPSALTIPDAFAPVDAPIIETPSETSASAETINETVSTESPAPAETLTPSSSPTTETISNETTSVTETGNTEPTESPAPAGQQQAMIIDNDAIPETPAVVVSSGDSGSSGDGSSASNGSSSGDIAPSSVDSAVAATE